MGHLQDQHSVFERKLREEKRLRSAQEIKFVEESATLQANLNDAVQQLLAVRATAAHTAERLAIAQAFIQRALKGQNELSPRVDVAVQTMLFSPSVSSGVNAADNHLLSDISYIAALPKTPQSPTAADSTRHIDSVSATAQLRASLSPSVSGIRNDFNKSLDLQDALNALAKAEEAASTYRKELIEVTGQSAKDAHQFRLDILNALVLAMDLTEIRGILKGSYAISRITPKGLTGPTGVSEERARRGQALLDEIETGVVSKAHELVEWASEYEAELETKVAILIARKKLREKLDTVVGQMGAMRSTQIAGQRNDLLKALKRIEREVQSVTMGDMVIISNLSGSDFTQVCHFSCFQECWPMRHLSVHLWSSFYAPFSARQCLGSHRSRICPVQQNLVIFFMWQLCSMIFCIAFTIYKDVSHSRCCGFFDQSSGCKLHVTFCIRQKQSACICR
jgi:hypothetical protein